MLSPTLLMGKFDLDKEELSRLIEMAWEDRTPFDAIFKQYGLKENDVMKLMQKNLKKSSYVLWRKRVKEIGLKHQKKRGFITSNAYASNQYKPKS
jgi:uncharacterized protein (TIGR03643 family)